MYINRVHNSYVSTAIFRGEFDDRVQSYRDDYNLISWNLYGRRRSKEAVEKAMKQEIEDLEKDVARKEAERDSLRSSLSSLKSYHSSMINSKESSKSTLERKKQSNLSTISSLESTLSGLNSTLSNLEFSNGQYQKTISQQEDSIRGIEEKNKQIAESQKTYEIKVQKDVDSKIKKLNESQELKLMNLEHSLDSTVLKPNKMNREIYCSRPEGFGAIVGYKAEKEQIRKFFGQSVVLERYGNPASVPNGILLCGPDKEFTAEFASRVAKQYDIKFVELDKKGDEVQRLKNIRNEAEKAKKEYEKSGKRTLILIRDLEEFAPTGNKIVGPMKSFMDRVSKESYATIIATTANFDLLDNILVRSGRFFSIAIPPVKDKTNIIPMLKSCIGADTLATTNIELLTKQILTLQNEGCFSVKKLKNVIQTMLPDIDKSLLESFEKQAKLMKLV